MTDDCNEITMYIGGRLPAEQKPLLVCAALADGVDFDFDFAHTGGELELLACVPGSSLPHVEEFCFSAQLPFRTYVECCPGMPERVTWWMPGMADETGKPRPRTLMTDHKCCAMCRAAKVRHALAPLAAALDAEPMSMLALECLRDVATDAVAELRAVAEEPPDLPDFVIT